MSADQNTNEKMKTLQSLIKCLVFMAGLLPWLQAPSTFGQSAAHLDLRMYSSVSITGVVGQTYLIEYASEPAGTNTWYSLGSFQLKWNPYEWVDTTQPATSRRFYRVSQVEVPKNVVPITNMVFIAPGKFIMGSP